MSQPGPQQTSSQLVREHLNERVGEVNESCREKLKKWNSVSGLLLRTVSKSLRQRSGETSAYARGCIIGGVFRLSQKNYKKTTQANKSRYYKKHLTFW